jgi:hypothetical protein
MASANIPLPSFARRCARKRSAAPFTCDVTEKTSTRPEDGLNARFDDLAAQLAHSP